MISVPHTSSTLATALVDQLLGLKNLSWSDPGAQLGWQHPLPAWGWAIVALAALAVAGWSYWRLEGQTAARTALAVARALLLLLIVALIAGPTLVLPREQVEPDWLLVLVDRSQSMQIKDAVTAGGSPTSRDAALRAALAQHTELLGPQKLGKDRRLVWLGFDAHTYEIAAPDKPDGLSPAEGQATAIATAIEQALQRAVGRPVSGVVLMTDGRSPQSTGAELVRRLKQQGVSVFSVPLGALKSPPDLAVGRVDYPDRALVNDTVPVRVWVDRFPLDAAVDMAQVRVRLIDTVTGQTLDEKPAISATGEGARPDDPVRLSARSAAAGAAVWRVEVVYEPTPGAGDASPLAELVTDNNQRTINLELINRPIRVLYVEGYPRWEYRYLKNMILREKAIQSSIMLLSADSAFAQEGDLPIARLPETAEELEPYDVIILGDAAPEAFSAAQLGLIRDHVATRGAGLLWIGGAYFTPRAYDGTPLADLLPMRRPGSVDRVDESLGTIAMAPTPLAEALNIMRLHPGTAGTAGQDSGAEAFIEMDALPGLRWAQELGALQPTAEVLAHGVATAGQTTAEASRSPLVVRLRYGAGQSLYVGTDDTWRWRFGRGDVFFEQFWTQLVQMLGRARLQQSDRTVWLDVSHHRVQVGEAVVLTLRVEDPTLLKRELPRVSVSASRGEGQAEEIELLPQAGPGGPGEAEAARREYRAVWQPQAGGNYTMRISEAALADMGLTQEVDVIPPDDEMRQVASDHARLAALSEQTGGKVVALDQLEDLATLVPNRARRTPLDIREQMWDSPLALMLIVLLFTAEWVGRKVIRLI